MGEPVNYSDLEVKDLEKLVEDRGIEVTDGSGQNGSVVKVDLVKALHADDAKDTGDSSKEPEEPKTQGADSASEDDKPTFTREALVRRGSRSVGYPSAVIAGALAGASKKDEFTIAEAKAACADWVKSEAQA